MHCTLHLSIHSTTQQFNAIFTAFNTAVHSSALQCRALISTQCSTTVYFILHYYVQIAELQCTAHSTLHFAVHSNAVQCSAYCTTVYCIAHLSEKSNALQCSVHCTALNTSLQCTDPVLWHQCHCHWWCQIPAIVNTHRPLHCIAHHWTVLYCIGVLCTRDHWTSGN